MRRRSVGDKLPKKKNGGKAVYFCEVEVNATIYRKVGCTIMKMIKCSGSHAFRYSDMPDAVNGRPVPWVQIPPDELLVSEAVAEAWFKKNQALV